MRRLPHPGAVCLALLLPSMARAEPLGDEWGTGEREAEYYKITEIPVPAPHFIEAGCFATLPDGRVAVGTRRGGSSRDSVARGRSATAFICSTSRAAYRRPGTSPAGRDRARTGQIRHGAFAPIWPRASYRPRIGQSVAGH